MKFRKEEIREAVTTIYTRMLNGLSDQEIAEEMGLSLEDFTNLKQTMMEVKSTEVRNKPDEHVYVEYMIEQNKNIKDLTDMIAEFKSKKDSKSMVAAIRARADILDKLLTKGQEFGFVHREPHRKEIVAGVAIQELSSDKLRELVMGELAEMNRMMKTFGDQNIIDISEPKELHYSKEKKKKALPPAKKDKRNKAKTTSVSKGRRKILPPSPLER